MISLSVSQSQGTWNGVFRDSGRHPWSVLVVTEGVSFTVGSLSEVNCEFLKIVQTLCTYLKTVFYIFIKDFRLVMNNCFSCLVEKLVCGVTGKVYS